MALTLAELLELATKLADRVSEDINSHGGLTSSDTIRAADQLRLEISRFRPIVAELEIYLRHRETIYLHDTRYDDVPLHQLVSELDA